MPCLKGKTRALIASSNAAVDSETGCFFTQDNYRFVLSYSGNLISYINAKYNQSVIIRFGFSPDAGLYSSVSFILSKIKGKSTKKCDQYS